MIEIDTYQEFRPLFFSYKMCQAATCNVEALSFESVTYTFISQPNHMSRCGY